MAGRMGGNRTTVHNLEVARVDEEGDRLYVRGAVPGKAGSIIRVTDAIRRNAQPKDIEIPFPTVSLDRA